MTMRTSETDPLRIAELRVGAGHVGVTLCPGKQGHSAFGAGWARDLALDVEAIREWGADAVVTLIEAQEFELLGVPALPLALREAGLEWHYLPVTRRARARSTVRDALGVRRRAAARAVACRGSGAGPLPRRARAAPGRSLRWLLVESRRRSRVRRSRRCG